MLYVWLMCHRLQEIIDQTDACDSELSALERWISDAVQTIDTVNRSLQTVPPSTEQLASVSKLLSVCCIKYIYVCQQTVHMLEGNLNA